MDGKPIKLLNHWVNKNNETQKYCILKISWHHIFKKNTYQELNFCVSSVVDVCDSATPLWFNQEQKCRMVGGGRGAHKKQQHK